MITPGTTVRVRDDWPETRGKVHIRTPHYLRGRTGRVVRHLGNFPNPEELAFARPARTLPLYHVLFDQPPLWEEGSPGDEVLVEIYEPWLMLEQDGIADAPPSRSRSLSDRVIQTSGAGVPANEFAVGVPSGQVRWGAPGCPDSASGHHALP